MPNPQFTSRISSPENLALPSSEQTVQKASIEKLVYGGDGLGRLPSGEVCFVPFAVPGEAVSLSVRQEVKKILKGTILEIEQPSSNRVEPKCTVFTQCGGCQWQHIRYAEQIHWKTKIVEENLVRLGGFKDIAVEPIKSTAVEDEQSAWRYRNRVQWDVQTVKNSIQLGYKAGKSQTLVEFSDCHIISDVMNSIYHSSQRMLNLAVGFYAKHLRRIEVIENEAGQIFLSFYGLRHPQLTTLAHDLATQYPAILGIVLVDEDRPHKTAALLAGVSTNITFKVNAFEFQVSANSFFQTNTALSATLLEDMQSWLHDDTDSLLDLYAGGGFFSIALHNKAKQITAVEIAHSSIQDAQANLKQNNIDTIRLIERSVDNYVKTERLQFDAAVIDPPRSGSTPAVLKWLSENIKKQLLYVSCNPATLARDLKLLVQLGWSVKHVQPYDMFPQTYHIETLVHLEKG